jgi:hypothetical protein
LRELPVENEVCRPLGLCGGDENHLAIIVQLLQPAGDIGGLVFNNGSRNSSLGAKISGPHFRAKFLSGIRCRPKGGGFGDGVARKALWMSSAVHVMPISA